MTCFPLLDGDEIGMDGMGCDGVDHEMNYPTAWWVGALLA
jgi:hypothetical protein